MNVSVTERSFGSGHIPLGVGYNANKATSEGIDQYARPLSAESCLVPSGQNVIMRFIDVTLLQKEVFGVVAEQTDALQVLQLVVSCREDLV